MDRVYRYRMTSNLCICKCANATTLDVRHLTSFCTTKILPTVSSSFESRLVYWFFILTQSKWKHLDRDQNMGTIDMFKIANVMEELMGDRFKSRYTTQPQYQMGINLRFLTKVKRNAGLQNRNIVSTSSSKIARSQFFSQNWF